MLRLRLLLLFSFTVLASISRGALDAASNLFGPEFQSVIRGLDGMCSLNCCRYASQTTWTQIS